eukprot:COSAG03_NODE_14557_length_460_cov_0.684211_1_plen_22_part_10
MFRAGVLMLAVAGASLAQLARA